MGKTKKQRGRPKLKPGEAGNYPSGRKPAKRPRSSLIKMVNPIEKSLKMEEEMFKEFYAIYKHRWQEIVRALILAHLKEQPPKPASATEAEAGSRDSRYGGGAK